MALLVTLEDLISDEMLNMDLDAEMDFSVFPEWAKRTPSTVAKRLEAQRASHLQKLNPNMKITPRANLNSKVRPANFAAALSASNSAANSAANSAVNSDNEEEDVTPKKPMKFSQMMKKPAARTTAAQTSEPRSRGTPKKERKEPEPEEEAPITPITLHFVHGEVDVKIKLPDDLYQGGADNFVGDYQFNNAAARGYSSECIQAMVEQIAEAIKDRKPRKVSKSSKKKNDRKGGGSRSRTGGRGGGSSRSRRGGRSTGQRRNDRRW